METLHVLWFVIGFALLAAEMLTGTFFMLFMGLAALTVGALKFMISTHWSVEVIIFGAISASLALFYMKRKRNGAPGNGYSPTETFLLDTDIPAQGEGKVQYHGSPWTALNMTAQPLHKGDRVVVVRTEGVKLILEKAKEI